MWIKICGIRDAATAQMVAGLMPDAMGLNFYAGTVRVVSPSTAADFSHHIPAEITPVGLFVNHSVAEIVEITQQVPLRLLQLHGDESPEFLAQLQARVSLPVVRAWRAGEEGLGPLAEYLAECRERQVTLAAVLIDARVSGQYGGSGHTAPWELLREEYHTTEWPRLVLAGGLTPDNVAEAIETVRPWGVDVSSGVEREPGVKDPNLTRRFIELARQAAAGAE
ncbi:MAG: phosphoribosylanthranilate isomerase [Planctomycetaceae bacterium]|nr:phosphoribosylanthranilate isomerase [Planctomycetaceae bacterium]